MKSPYPSIPTRPIENLRSMLDDSVRLFPLRPAFHLRTDEGDFEQISYTRLREEIDLLGSALDECGLTGRRIAVIGENCYGWALSYLTVVCGGGVVLPLDRELCGEEIGRICQVAKVDAILHGASIADRIAAAPLPKETVRIGFDALPLLIERGRELLLQGREGYLLAPIEPDALSVLLFTSGTTGVSKGVMLSQRNLCYTIEQCSKMIAVSEQDLLLSVLPLHHTYECTIGFLLPLYHGASIAYAERLSTVARDLRQVQATAMICVPLLLESFLKKIWQSAEKSGKVDKLRAAIALNRKCKRVGLDLSRSLFSELRKSFGGRLRLLVSGGAAAKPEVLSGLRELGLTAIQGYGLTECAPLTTVNPEKAAKDASAGLCLPDSALRIADPDENGIGEICYRGENVMLGYYENPSLTAEVIRDGWFHTGDLGFLDPEGYLFITGRKKNVIVTRGGKNVFPEEIEEHLCRNEFIAEAMVVGEEEEDDVVIKAYLYPDPDRIAPLLREGGLEGSEPEARQLIRSLLEKQVIQVNRSLSSYKRIRRIVVRSEPFEKTSTRKIRRAAAENRAEGED